MKSVRAVYKLIRIYKVRLDMELYIVHHVSLKVHYIQLSNCSLTVQLHTIIQLFTDSTIAYHM